jgi:hypothetical protein
MEGIFSWAKRAKCRKESILQENLTKKYCTDCPVRGLCNTYAIVHKELGIWGGTSETDRQRLYNWFPEFIDLLTSLYKEASLLENRSQVDPLEHLMHLVGQQQVHNGPNVLIDPYQDPILSQSA